jgi:hypothetical protein
MRWHRTTMDSRSTVTRRHHSKASFGDRCAPGWKLPGLTHCKHAIGNTRMQAQKVPLPCQYPDAAANRHARPGVDIGSRYLSLRNSPGRVGCAALQRGCTRTVRPRRKGLCSEVRARSESERTTRCRLHAADADSAPIQRSFPVAIGCADGHARRIHSSRRLHEHRARHRRRLRRHQVRPWC